MNRVIAFANILVAFISLLNAVAVAQESARTVQYHSQDIVPIRAKLKFTTLIEVLIDRKRAMEAATWRQGVLDCRCGWEFLFCASCAAVTGDQLNPINLITDKGEHL